MLLTITLIISALVAINFLLLKFSCNKTSKPKTARKKPIVFTLNQGQKRLAPTGS